MFYEYGRKRPALYEQLLAASSLEILEERCARGELPPRELELTGHFLKTLRPRVLPAGSVVPGISREE